jgi:hypothetical protein
MAPTARAGSPAVAGVYLLRSHASYLPAGNRNRSGVISRRREAQRHAATTLARTLRQQQSVEPVGEVPAKPEPPTAEVTLHTRTDLLELRVDVIELVELRMIGEERRERVAPTENFLHAREQLVNLCRSS